MAHATRTLPYMEQDLTPPKSDPVIEAYKRDVDRTLIRERLKLDPEQRIIELIRLQAWANELAQAGATSRT